MIDKLFQFRLKRMKAKYERRKAKQELKAKYAQYYPQREGAKVSNVMLAVIVIAITGYAIANFALQYFTGSEVSSTLTTCWFAFWGAEIVSLTGIKVSKVLKQHRDNHDSLG